MSTWMINGPGQALFLGNPNVSQFNPTGQTSPGSGYVPDEVAKMIVKESGLRKSDCIPKKVIVGYLESMGLSPGLAPDVAMVLRNVYGLTPTFDESTLYSGSGALIEELMGVVNESYPAPFKFDEPEVINEITSYLAKEYLESEDDGYDIVIEHLASMNQHDFLDVVDFYEWVGPEGFAYLSDLMENGPDGLAEQVVEGLCFPDNSLSEDVQYHIEKIDMDAALRKGQSARRMTDRGISDVVARGRGKYREKVGRKKQRNASVSAKKQMKRHYRDMRGGEKADPLKDRQSASKKSGVSAMKSMSGAEVGARKDAIKGRAIEKRKADRKASLQAGGKKALSLMKKVGGAAASAGIGAVKMGAKAVGAVGGYAAGKAVGAVKGAATAGRAAATSAARTATSGTASSAKSAAKKDGKKSGDGILSKVGRAIGGFAKSVKAGYKAARPGVADQSDKAKEPSREKGPAGSANVGESFYRNGDLLSEMRNSLDGVEAVEEIEEPADVFASFEASDIVGQAVLEALSQLDWDEVSQLASIAMLPVEESQSLVSAYQNGSGDFFHAWRGASSRVGIPSALKKESFDLLASLSMDEGVVPALVGYSVRALQSACEDVAMCVEDAYPDLGKTVYGPAGNPKEGPDLAKSFMTPHAYGTDRPSKERQVMTTRMFADPSSRKKERASKLSDVMKVLKMMHTAASASGVDPEGMFLNTHRDMHRERARYS